MLKADELSYKDLQRVAKENGLKANLKADALRALLIQEGLLAGQG
jgi:hypothetical protein